MTEHPKSGSVDREGRRDWDVSIELPELVDYPVAEVAVTRLSAAEWRLSENGFPQVERLLEIHALILDDTPKRREPVSKAAVTLLCAAWEAFVEDLAAEVLRNFAEHCHKAELLPLPLRKSVLKELQARKDELSMWGIAGEGWREILRNRATALTDWNGRQLNTPSSSNVNDFLSGQAGIVNVRSAWHWPGVSPDRASSTLDALLQLRHQIAHRGGLQKGLVTKEHALRGLRLVRRLSECTIAETDRQVRAITFEPLVNKYKLIPPSRKA